MPYYLGFDLSTQQLKAIIVDSSLTVIASAKVDFDVDLPHHATTAGVHSNPAESTVVAPVNMWFEAVDLVLNRLSKISNLSEICAISGSCQQHGSIHWNDKAEGLLAGLPGMENLRKGLEGGLSWGMAPNWQDGSTQRECDVLDAALGSPEALAQATGSAAHHRFTGPQIMRLRRVSPEIYKATTRISLVSSFLASVFLGSFAPLDISDACGMNLFDIPTSTWSTPLLSAIASPSGAADLASKLGPVRRDGGGSLGKISKYFVHKYGFAPSCDIAPFTGDNPATILALPLRPLDAIVSLGTSTTFLMSTPVYKPDPSYHFFNHPTTEGMYMFMLCYKNGGLARKKVRDTLWQSFAASASPSDPWSEFNKQILETPRLHLKSPATPAKLGLYFYLPEIVPNLHAGTWRFTADPSGTPTSVKSVSADTPWSPADDARTIVESQALSMKLRARPLVSASAETPGAPAQPRRIYLVGGGSLNPAIQKVIGDVLGGTEGVYTLDVGGNSCALGGAYKAVWAVERGEGETFDEMIGKRWKEEGAVKKVGEGYEKEAFETYEKILPAFEEIERLLLEEKKRS